MLLAGLFERFEKLKDAEAMVWSNKSYSYSWLLGRIRVWHEILAAKGIKSGSVIQLDADFSPESVAVLLALVSQNCIISPNTGMPKLKSEEFREIAQAEVTLLLDKNENAIWNFHPVSQKHEILNSLIEKKHPGLVLFSSGSTGKSKAAVHDFIPLLEKFEKPRKTMRVIAFLLFDHIGGINTLFYTLFNGGCVVVPGDRTPPEVCRAIEEHQVTALTTTPTFLTLMLLSEGCRRRDISSLKVINYGSEVMPEFTLKRLHQLLPEVRLSQGYGLSEVGVLPTVSQSSTSLYVQLKNTDGFQTRIVNGLLEIKSRSAMLGYLNAPAPFTEDGWFKTGDAVEVKGDYIRILGRASEMINVGGQKVYPAEVENVLQEMEGVEEVSVSGEKNPIVGQFVRAQVRISTGETVIEFRSRMRKFCQSRLAGYMIPQRVLLSENPLYGQRFKKMRHFAQEGI